MLQANGQVSVFFDNCVVPNLPPIETLAQSFDTFLRGLRYADGQPVTEADVVAHSMGSLIVRAYLAGKQPNGVYLPPVQHRIRKAVFLGAPNFGSFIARLSERNAQVDQLQVGAEFTFDLATWNQGLDDLRGVDALAIVGDAGTEINLVARAAARFHDSTVTLSSASLDFAIPGRTRIVNYCHTSGIADLVCGNREYLARFTNDQHLAARATISFLNGTDEWRSIGEAPEANAFLSRGAGLFIQWRDANDRPIPIRTAVIAGRGEIDVRGERIAYTEYVPNSPLQLTLTSTTGATTTLNLPAAAGATRALTVKAGPFIGAAIPVFALIQPRVLAPGMLVSIYGSELAPRTEQAASVPFPTTLAGIEVRLGEAAIPLQYASPTQITAVIPDNASGGMKLTVKSPVGEHSVNVVVEPAAPALYAGPLIPAESPLRPGDFVTLYGTGIGAVERGADGLERARVQPQVMLGDRPCEVQYAGRAPNFAGLDQINCRLAVDLPTNASTPVVVRSGNRASNVITVPVRQ